jgi:hypothetical protein
LSGRDDTVQTRKPMLAAQRVGFNANWKHRSLLATGDLGQNHHGRRRDF